MDEHTDPFDTSPLPPVHDSVPPIDQQEAEFQRQLAEADPLPGPRERGPRDERAAEDYV